MKKTKPLPIVAYVHAARRTYSDAPWIVSVTFAADVEDPPFDGMVPTRAGRVRLRDLSLNAMILRGQEYSPRVEFSQVFSLELRDAEACVATLRTLHSRLRGVAEAYGPSTSLETTALRLFTLMGVSCVKVSKEALAVTYREEVPDHVRESDWHVHAPDDGARAIGHVVRMLCEKTRKAA